MNIGNLANHFSRTRSGVMLLVADLVGIAVSLVFTHLWGLDERDSFILMDVSSQFIILGTILPLLYLSYGLYPGVGISPVEELEKMTKSTSLGFLLIITLSLSLRNLPLFSHPVVIPTWLLTIFLVQLGRWAVRIVGTQTGIWGEPVVVIGDGQGSSWLVNYLLERKRLGLIPVIALDATGQNLTVPIPSIHLSSLFTPGHFSQMGIHTAIIVMRDNPSGELKLISQGKKFNFSRYILVSSSDWMGSLGVIPHDLEGLLGLEIRQNLSSISYQLAKIFLDFSIVLSTSIVFVPLFIVISLIVRLDSPGPIFYRSERIGKNGRRIQTLKFRSMVKDADLILAEYLRKHPEKKDEWNTYHKLKGDDPRVTRFGRFLRTTSLDELPQIWNVLKGEMSLVGPRPILPSEEEKYGQSIGEYMKVLPGITGLWQVSGRNHTTFEQRMLFDEYYIRNWSIWLDLYLLLRTVFVVLRRHGAY